MIARIVSLTAWACSALLMVPVFMYAATITKPTGGQNCNIFWPFDEDDDGDLSNGEAVFMNGTTTEQRTGMQQAGYGGPPKSMPSVSRITCV